MESSVPQETGLLDSKGNKITNSRWIKGPYPYIPLKKIMKKMIKLQKKFDKVKGAASKARIMRSYEGCEKKLRKIKKALPQPGRIILPKDNGGIINASKK